MKTKFIILSCFFLLCISFASHAQKKNVIKTNLLSPIIGTYHLNYERAINEKGSAQLGVFYIGYKRGETSFAGFGITPEYRFYVGNNPAPKGFYVAPSFRYQNFKLKTQVEVDGTTSSAEASFSAYGLAAIIGNQWIFSDVVSLDIYLGPSYNFGQTKVTTGTANEEDFSVKGFGNGFGLRAGLTLGVAF